MIAENPDIEGNLTIYFLFLISNICLLVLGIISIFISIYLIAITSSLSFINVTLFLFGIFFIVIAIYGFKLRSSIEGNLVYSIILSVTFVLDLVLTILLIEFKNLVVSWVIDKIQDSTQSIDELKKIMNRNFTEVNNLLIVILLIFFLIVAFSWLYRRSLIENTNGFKKLLITDIEYWQAFKGKETKSEKGIQLKVNTNFK